MLLGEKTISSLDTPYVLASRRNSLHVCSSFRIQFLLYIFFCQCLLVGSLDSVTPTLSMSAATRNYFVDFALRQGPIEESPPPIRTEWRDDVAQRYSELKPPSRKKCSQPQPIMLKGELMRKLSREKSRSLMSEASRIDPSRGFETIGIMLDLDKTCLFGNDGNDLGIALQWMDKSQQAVEQLYDLILNPALRPAYAKLSSQSKVKVAIYTMRASLLYYRSNFRGMIIPLQFAPEWHVDGQVIIPSSIATADDVMAAYTGPYLTSEEQTDICRSMQRLLAARGAIQRDLGLAAPPPVVITASGKDVPRTAAALGFPPASTFLWDDNPSLVGRPGVVPVPAYVELDRARRDKLASFLDEMLPACELDDDLLDFMASAHPGESVLYFDGPDGSVPVWSLPLSPEATVQPWPVPEPGCRPPSAEAPAPDGLLEGGCLSPVTPAGGDAAGSCASGMADGRRLLTARRPVAFEDL